MNIAEVPAVSHENSNFDRESNFKTIKDTNIKELLTSHKKHFFHKILLQYYYNEEDSDSSIEISEEQNSKSKKIYKMTYLIDEAMEMLTAQAVLKCARDVSQHWSIFCKRN